MAKQKQTATISKDFDTSETVSRFVWDDEIRKLGFTIKRRARGHEAVWEHKNGELTEYPQSVVERIVQEAKAKEQGEK